MWNLNKKPGFSLMAMMVIGAVIVATNATPIRNGTPVRPSEGTFVVRLQIRRSGLIYECTGAIIGPQYVLTAGHCIDGIDSPYGGNVYGGTIHRDDPNPIINTIVQSYKHPRYGTSMGGYDVGIIKVDKPFDITGRQSVLSVANREIDFNSRGTQFGWSNCQDMRQKGLNRGSVDFLSKEQCKKRGVVDQYPELLCVDTGSFEVCGGDSGGPIVSHGRVVGIASTGNDFGKPVTAQNVYFYSDWINSIIRR